MSRRTSQTPCSSAAATTTPLRSMTCVSSSHWCSSTRPRRKPRWPGSAATAPGGARGGEAQTRGAMRFGDVAPAVSPVADDGDNRAPSSALTSRAKPFSRGAMMATTRGRRALEHDAASSGRCSSSTRVKAPLRGLPGGASSSGPSSPRGAGPSSGGASVPRARRLRGTTLVLKLRQQVDVSRGPFGGRVL